jgi:hypothetical protein
MSEAMTYTAEVGCGCLGTMQVGAAGNVVFDRHTIAVGAYRESDGAITDYVSSDAHLFVSAPSNDYGFLGGIG